MLNEVVYYLAFIFASSMWSRMAFGSYYLTSFIVEISVDMRGYVCYV